jgi:hypothetical protein
MPFKFALPLPHFVLHPLTAWTIAAVPVYLAYGHRSKRSPNYKITAYKQIGIIIVLVQSWDWNPEQS